MTQLAVALGIVSNGIYTTAEVAVLVFRRTGVEPARWLYENRARLTREEGFPPPISRIGQPRWAGADLLVWMARPKDTLRKGKERRGTPPPDGPNIVDFAAGVRKAVKRRRGESQP